ncbi:restriction endonuclease subunit S [Acetobacterium sp.]|uniref:restriction endonuclease subunit S n=1 Tax=Acetobacterium sp. TaxID=1872094 RepID=UPI0035931A3B
MAKKKQELTVEEKLAAALVREDEQPYEVPENWVWTYLTKGHAECLDKFRKPVNATERADRYGDVPYYGATGQVGWIDDFLSNENLVLVGEDGAPFLDYLKEKAYIIEGKAWVNNHAHILKSFYGVIGNKYLMHYLNIFNFKDYVNGTTRLKLTQSSLNLIPIPLPPLAEQQRIVDRIESLFDQLDQAKALIQEALDSFETRKAAVLHQAFTGTLTKKWREEHGVGLESWEEKKSSSIFEYVTSGSRGWAQYYDTSGSIFIRMGNLDHGTIELDLGDIQYVNLPETVEGKRSKVEKNDILISITADVGMVGLVRNENMDAYINQHVALARPIRTVNAEFIAWFLVSDLGLRQLQSLQRGATKIGLTLGDLKNLTIKLPSLSEQTEIVRILYDLFAKEQTAKDLCDQSDQIDTIKKTILGQAFRGELGTNEAGEESAVALLKQALQD